MDKPLFLAQLVLSPFPLDQQLFPHEAPAIPHSSDACRSRHSEEEKSHACRHNQYHLILPEVWHEARWSSMNSLWSRLILEITISIIASSLSETSCGPPAIGRLGRTSHKRSTYAACSV